MASPSLQLFRPRTVRLDVAPFVVLYAAGFGSYLLLAPRAAALANALTPAIATCHLLAFLGCHWSLPLRLRLQWRRVRRVAEATAVRVRAPSTNRSELCLLRRRAAWGAPEAEETSFEHRKRTYVFTPAGGGGGGGGDDDEAEGFGELTMPLGLPLSHYLGGARGLRGEALRAAEHKYGRNHFAIVSVPRVRRQTAPLLAVSSLRLISAPARLSPRAAAQVVWGSPPRARPRTVLCLPSLLCRPLVAR